MIVRTVDIGNTSVKTKAFRVEPNLKVVSLDEMIVLGDPRAYWNKFEEWLLSRFRQNVLSLHLDAVLVSSPGIVNRYTGLIERYSSIREWTLRPLQKNLSDVLGLSTVRIMNDGEAHLRAHLNNFTQYPAVALSLGSAVGCCRTTINGQIMPPSECEVGDLRLPQLTLKVGHALGRIGFERLKNSTSSETEFNEIYSNDFIHLIIYLVDCWNAKQFVLSGGIVDCMGEQWGSFLQDVLRKQGKYIKNEPQIRISKYGREAALWGLAQSAYMLLE